MCFCGVVLGSCSVLADIFCVSVMSPCGFGTCVWQKETVVPLQMVQEGQLVRTHMFSAHLARNGMFFCVRVCV